ncbi:MAG: hypothetical protein HY810_03530 [Candidatus Omnitrophica bacterium]|nr:hypothetical protein [Candidatus Omnitrophota bacterium]
MNTGKKAYNKPVVKKVKLFTEEAVLAACKTAPAAVGKNTRTCSASACKTTLGS